MSPMLDGETQSPVKPLKMSELNPEGQGHGQGHSHGHVHGHGHGEGGLEECEEGKTKDVPNNAEPGSSAGTAAFVVFSFIYAKLLVAVCVCFLVAEVSTHQVPLFFFEGYFLYLYGVSILFLLYVFCYLLRDGTRSRTKRTRKVASGSKLKVNNLFQSALQRVSGRGEAEPEGESASQALTGNKEAEEELERAIKVKTTENNLHGSFFLRIGALAFGLGTMIYCGLEFGGFWEIPWNSPCHELINGLNPCFQMVFTFMQMYFIFMNAKLNIHKFKIVARFGLMHVIGTNICVWLRTLFREGLRDVTGHNTDKGIGPSEDQMILVGGNRSMEVLMETNASCARNNIVGNIRSDSAPFLYVFPVEYSLIGIAILFIMWRHIGPSKARSTDDDWSREKRRMVGRVDCVGASYGLFLGLLFLVGCAICLILFFVLIEKVEHHRLAIFLADVSHSAIIFLALFAALIGFCRVKHLKFQADRDDLLNEILLRLSGFGILLYAVLTIIAGVFSIMDKEPHLLVTITGVLTVLQVIVQILFLADVGKRSINSPEHEASRPGRQLITFLLICNLAMWALLTFEMQKVEANPVQLNFYGYVPWNILLKITLPLSIFHRFQATVMYADVWKNAYRLRIE
ncbi:unnamed protein product [Darwinula stevensoni]|uniref:Uncharacterized protein n=1 Tax=Darwinula stevensoni TaxID=69355 RepID=A0A7R8X1X6_9CRUS|nr:unnamed protein product [Darwinula stevensoni]CAG0882651.1 unnamed protein product [Darwinula stevensoni]